MEGKQGSLEKSDCVSWDSSAWERDDLGGIAKNDRS